MESVYDITLLTEPRYYRPKNLTPYIQDVLQEDQLVEDALRQLGFKTIRIPWSEESFDWASTKFALFRTTWDYFDRFDVFKPWLDQVSQMTQLINDSALIYWNFDKHYLQDLHVKGVSVIPTHYVYARNSEKLSEIVTNLGWQDIIIKPTISGTAKDTHLIPYAVIEQHNPLFESLKNHQDMMIQPVQEFILTTGEYSLIVIDGMYSHAVLKVAKPGDFRVQNDFGGTVHPYNPTREEIDFALAVTGQCDPQPIYARVDMIRKNDGDLALVELELIEPELWLRHRPQAAANLATAIKKVCS